MPDKLIKPSIWTSPNLNLLSDLAERHFYRILLSSDDWGCFEATPEIVKGICYPRKAGVTSAKIEQWQKELEDQKIIKTWVFDERLYGQFTTFDKHNDLKQHHKPTTPCPPWMLNEKNQDLRLASDTLEAYQRISDTLQRLYSENIEPTYRMITTEAKCSNSTLKNYLRYVAVTGRYTPLHSTTVALLSPTIAPPSTPVAKNSEIATGLLHLATGATDKNPNPKHKPNPKPNIYDGGVTEPSDSEGDAEMKNEKGLSNNHIFAEIQKYVGFPDIIPIDPFGSSYNKEAGLLKLLRNRGISDNDIIQCWKDLIDSQNNDFVSISWVNYNIFNWFKNGKKLINRNNGHNENKLKLSPSFMGEDVDSIKELDRING
jgi:hypothetical protein